MSPIIEPGAALPTIPQPSKIERFGQVQKIVFQRRTKDDNTPNKFIKVSADPKEKASWTPLLAAVDDTKVTPTPFISEPENEPGEARTYGGGNATLNGIPLILGKEPSPFTCKLLESTQDVSREIQKLMREEGNLAVFLINEHGQIGMLSDGKAQPEEYYPIPIHSFFITDKVLGGFEEPDSNEMQFMFAPNWSHNFVVITPEDAFYPLHDIVHAAQ